MDMTLFAARMRGFLAVVVLVGGCIGVAPVAPPDAPAADKAEAVRGNHAFAVELYGKLRRREGNLCLSPASLSTALALTYAGARGETADQMAEALHFG
jgi:serpin B